MAADGTLVAGAGVSAVQRIGTGSYDVGFGEPVAECAHVATIAVADANTGATGQIAVAAGPQPSVVRVETETSSGTNANKAFHLAALC